MEAEKTVATPAPESAPAPEPQPQADAAENTVSIGELMANQNAAKDKAGSSAPAAKPEPKPDPAPAAQSREQPKPDKPQEPAAPKSQKDIDFGVGKRIEAERKKWNQEHAEDLRIARMLREANPEKSVEDLVADLETQRTAALGITPGLASVLKSKGLLDAEPAEAAAPDLSSEDGREAIAERWGAEMGEITKVDPDFDFNKFMEENAASVDRLLSGELTLTGLYFSKNAARLIQAARDKAYAEGQQAAVDNIRNRNDRLPNPPNPSAPATLRPDFANMSSKEFQEWEERIKREQAKGNRVVL